MAGKEEKAKDGNQEIELISLDKISFKVKANLLQEFPWFAGMINFEPDKNVFDFKRVDGETLGKIIEWMEYEGKGEMPALIDPDTKLQRQLTPWEENFLANIDDKKLVQLMIHADYFDIKNLLEILTFVTSQKIVLYPIEQIRVMFDIKESGYTPQEEQKLESEIQWAVRFQD
ncbi:SKP1-like protein 17 [Chelonus insularis]|uniref:SKP1-like protein 17 n=1 Tax=Chelonus insularis TaxID=460826 RepID=UPI00158EC392|nr:SKP1-like protein 17 [Chelonus insularis]XP_034939314.1 SKP1-like protein 17 [Chelonus insularis]